MVAGPGQVELTQPRQMFSVTVEGLDEHTMKREWDEIWRLVAIRQQMLRDQSGQRPSGRRAPSLQRLRDALPLYRAWLVAGTVEGALSELEEAGSCLAAMDAETARRVLNDVDDLFRPVE